MRPHFNTAKRDQDKSMLYYENTENPHFSKLIC